MIALFGGRFDPIHNGHLAIAREVLKVKAADEVWFSIENQHQWRPIVASAQDRQEMVRLAINSVIASERSERGNLDLSANKAEIASSSMTSRNDERYKIDLTPIKLGGLTETISVVREIRKKVKDRIIFVVGSDQLESFDKWTHWKDLQKELQFLIVARKGSPIENVPKNCIILDDPTYEPLEDSATRIREYRNAGKLITGLVPEEVEKYIIEYKLYQF